MFHFTLCTFKSKLRSQSHYITKDKQVIESYSSMIVLCDDASPQNWFIINHRWKYEMSFV